MKFFIVAILWLGLLFLTSCGGDDGTSPPPPGPDEEHLTTVTVGTSGGTLTADGFSLEIPAGAFGDDLVLDLYSRAAVDSLGIEGASGLLKIEGLPNDYAEALTVRIQVNETAKDSEALIICGQDGLAPSIGAVEMGWMPLAATVDGQWWQAQLPALAPADRTTAAPEPGIMPPLYVQAVSSQASLVSDEGNFRIWHPDGDLMELIAEEVAESCEIAFAQYQSMGFEFDSRTRWPFDVILCDLRTGLYGGFWHIPVENYCYIMLNTDYLTDLDEASATVGHEVFHFAQYHNDPRPGWEKHKDIGAQYWFNEATAVWAEDLFVAGDYVSTARRGLEIEPFFGMATPTGSHPGKHGYGMSSMVKYLVDRYDSDFIDDTYADLYAGVNFNVALQNNLPAPFSEWWDDFLTQLAGGGIYHDVSVSSLLNISLRNWHALEGASPLTLDVSSVDLSGDFVQIVLFDEYEDETLHLETSAADCSISVFEMAWSGNLNHLSSGSTNVTLDNLQALGNASSSLLVLLANHHAESPSFNTVRTVPLDCELQVPDTWLPFNSIEVAINNFRRINVGGGSTDYANIRCNSFGATFDGTMFTASWDTFIGGYQSTGDLTLTVDPNDHRILSWTADQRDEWSNGAYGYVEIGGTGPIVLTDYYQSRQEMWFVVSGEEACTHVESLYQIYYDSQGQVVHELANYECLSNTVLRFILKVEE